MTELSAFEVLALAKEIDSTLRGSYVNNIYSLGDGQLVRFRGPSGDDIWLVVSPSYGTWVSRKISERQETNEFTSRLRKEISRARVAGATQVDFDRIFQIDFEGPDRKLLVEMMPPGNIIVTDVDWKVVLAEREVRSPRRTLVRGSRYEMPKQNRVSPVDLVPSDVAKFAGQEDTVGKAVGRHIALPRKYVAEVLRRLGLAEGDHSESLSGKEQKTVDAIGALVAEARESSGAVLCETAGGDEVFVVKPASLEAKLHADTVSALCDELFVDRVTRAKETPDDADRERAEAEATISKLEAQSDELISLSEARRELAKKAAGASTVEDAESMIREAGVPLGAKGSSTAALSSRLFDQAKALEAKARDAKEAAKKLSRKASRRTASAKPPPKMLTKRSPEWYERFRWFWTSEGRLAVGGRDAQSNANLIRRHLESNDVVYHADLFGSPFFVLKEGADQSDAESKEVAQATVAFSSAWKTGLGAADAYWVTPDQVSTAAPSGEYLARGSFSIRGKKNFVSRNLVEVAVGLEKDGRVVAGPESALRGRSVTYVVVRPHREKSSETAKKVLAELRRNGPDFGSLTLDEVQRALPPGGGKVVRRAGGKDSDDTKVAD